MLKEVVHGMVEGVGWALLGILALVLLYAFTILIAWLGWLGGPL
jgi:hypothetical protein